MDQTQWIKSIPSQNGRSICVKTPDLMMESDSSLQGWGAVCKGVLTGGLWSPKEKLSQINCLKSTAAMFAAKVLSWNKDSSYIHLKLDNQTAASYINPRLNNLATQLWSWCLERGINLSAEHLPGVDNCVADFESNCQQNGSIIHKSQTE